MNFPIILLQIFTLSLLPNLVHAQINQEKISKDAYSPESLKQKVLNGSNYKRWIKNNLRVLLHQNFCIVRPGEECDWTERLPIILNDIPGDESSTVHVYQSWQLYQSGQLVSGFLEQYQIPSYTNAPKVSEVPAAKADSPKALNLKPTPEIKNETSIPKQDHPKSEALPNFYFKFVGDCADPVSVKDAKNEMEPVINYLKNNPTVKIKLKGHIGTTKKGAFGIQTTSHEPEGEGPHIWGRENTPTCGFINVGELMLGRANYVRSAFIEAGIDPSRILAVLKGSSNNNARNRRVSIEYIK